MTFLIVVLVVFFPFPYLFSSYLLKNNITIEASKVNFPALTLKEQLGKVRFLHDFVWKIARNTIFGY